MSAARSSVFRWNVRRSFSAKSNSVVLIVASTPQSNESTGYSPNCLASKTPSPSGTDSGCSGCGPTMEYLQLVTEVLPAR